MAKLRVVVTGSLALALAMAGVAQTGPGAASEAVKTAGETFKNIQVLKSIPASQLIPTMRYITVALGVRCSFCHVEGNFSQDTEHKQTARRMMEMVFSVNKSTFNGRSEISCYTCHRGSSHPESVPALAAEGAVRSPAPDNAPAAARPTAEQLVQKYLVALGGADAVAAIHSVVEKGTLATPRGAVSVEIDRKAPDKELVLFQSPQGARRQGFDGTTRWQQRGDAAARIVSGPQAASAAPGAPLFRAAALAQNSSRLRVLGSEKVDGQDAWRVAARRERGGFEILDFDAKTGLLVRIETFRRTPLGALPEATDYSDYRDVQGVKLPFTAQLLGAENARTFKFDSVTANEKLDDARFQPPAAAAGSGARQ